MAEFSFSKSLLGNKKRGALTGSHVAYGLFVLICCWAERADAQHADPRPGGI